MYPIEIQDYINKGNRLVKRRYYPDLMNGL